MAAIAALIAGLLIGSFALPGSDPEPIERRVTVTAPARTVTTPAAAEPCELEAFARLRSRGIVKGVHGSVRLRPGRNQVLMTVRAKVPDRRFAVALYTSRDAFERIVTGHQGTVEQDLRKPLHVVAKHRYVDILAVVKRPPRKGRRGRKSRRAREQVRTLARVRVSRLLAALDCAPRG